MLVLHPSRKENSIKWCGFPIRGEVRISPKISRGDRKSTRLNSSHSQISYAVFCLKKTKYSLTMFEIATWRAVEQRRMLVRASTSGPSAFVDVTGAVLQRTAPFTAATITRTIQPSTIITTYCRVGAAFAFGCAAIVALTF